MKAIILTTLLALTHAAIALGGTELMTRAQATEFCEKVWLPRLRVGHPPSPDELRQAVSRLLELYSDEIEMVDPNSFDKVQADSFKGKGQVSKYYEWILSKYPVWNVKILEIYPNERGFVMRYEATNAGPVRRFEGVDILELEKAGARWRIKKIMMYYDRVPFRAKTYPNAQRERSKEFPTR